MNHLQELINNKELFFAFMKGKYPIFYNSNIFERDLQYGIKQFFERRDIEIKYPAAEELMKKFARYLEEEGDLAKLTANSWRVNFFKPEPETEEEKVLESKS